MNLAISCDRGVSFFFSPHQRSALYAVEINLLSELLTYQSQQREYYKRLWFHGGRHEAVLHYFN